MNASSLSKLCNICLQHQPQLRHISFSGVSLLDQRFRKQRGLPLNPNVYGVLTDAPDYSYNDGRLTPLGVGQRRRVVRNHEAKMQAIKLAGEIDFAVERHKILQQEEEKRRQELLDKKLKPKGTALLESHSKK